MRILSCLLIIAMLFSLASCVVAEPIYNGETQKESENSKNTENTESEEDSGNIDVEDTQEDSDGNQITEDCTEESDKADAESNTATESDTDTEIDTDTDTETETETKTEPFLIEFPLVKNGKAEASIVIAEDASRHVLYARDRIQLSVKDLANIPLAEEGESSFEILIGDTGRAESAELKATLGADQYAVKLVENKLIIVASNEAFLYEAARYFVDTYLTESYATLTDTDIVLFAEDIDVKRAGDKTSIPYKLSTGQLLDATGVATYTLNNEKYGATDADPRIYRRQGGCFTGKVWYQAFITKEEERAVLARLDVTTGELIYAEPRLMDHANDVTYNPYTNRVYVGYGKKVWIYDGDTLEFIEEKAISNSASRISYSPERHTFVLGSYNFCDESLKSTGQSFKSQLVSLYGDLDLNSQGTSCDDTFIYSLLFEKASGGNYNAYIGIFDWYGNTLVFVTVEIPGKFEPENISIVDGTLYIAACSTQPVATMYKVIFN